MNQILSPIIQANQLLELVQKESIVLIDASNGKNAKENHLAKHLKGALFVDINTQLADIKANLSEGGRHPLPTSANFANTLTKLGIKPQSYVVVYDDNNGSNAAARFWWMLKAIGHQKIQVLNGGLKQAEKTGFPLSNDIEIALKTDPYPISEWKLPLSNITEVENVAQNKNYLVIDVRDSEHYKGNIEPIDLVAGHIQGAINIPFSTNLDDNGLFLAPKQLKTNYLKIFEATKPENVIVHCGSGVTACHTLLAIAYAGLEIPKLYVGSWSEWSRNDKEIATQIKE